MVSITNEHFLCQSQTIRSSRKKKNCSPVEPLCKENRQTSFDTMTTLKVKVGCFQEGGIIEQLLKPFFFFLGLSGAMASISVRSSTPGSPTHVSSGSNASRRRNGLHDVDLNTFISEEMALHLDNGGTRKRTSAQCGDVITDSPTHKGNRMI